MAKYNLRIKARKLREKGASVKSIAQYLNISKSTASLWVRDIILSVEQLEHLRQSEIKGAELGRLRSALLQKNKRIQLIKSARNAGIKELLNINKRELLIAGIALYWGEGSKKTLGLQFCNSDPKMIKFHLGWLKSSFGIELSDIRCSVGINEIHRHREEIVKQFWSSFTNIPLSQFTKTKFKKVNNKKVYSNFNEHYGTLTVSVLKPSRYYYKILGLIEGLHAAGMKLAFQDVS